jgi:predicted ATPase
VKINLASSGQQEVVWLFNLLFYYLIEQRKVFLIVEEPESHLYPASQQTISHVLALMLTSGNTGIVTTHSPYVLSTLNYLMLAGQVPVQRQEEVKPRLNKRFWLDAERSNAYYIHDGKLETAVNEDDGLKLIKNELIDGASTEINALSDFLLGFLFSEEG